jgi:hypothetical protein
MSNEDLKRLTKQNDTIIMLLGRLASKEQEIKDIVTRKKQNPERYIQGYNACDGGHTVTQIAAVVGVRLPTVVPIL